LIGRNKGHLEVTSNGVSSDPPVATIKKSEERIEDLILIRLPTCPEDNSFKNIRTIEVIGIDFMQPYI
jgi:hypothetical protein